MDRRWLVVTYVLLFFFSTIETSYKSRSKTPRSYPCTYFVFFLCVYVSSRPSVDVCSSTDLAYVEFITTARHRFDSIPIFIARCSARGRLHSNFSTATCATIDWKSARKTSRAKEKSEENIFLAVSVFECCRLPRTKIRDLENDSAWNHTLNSCLAVIIIIFETRPTDLGSIYTLWCKLSFSIIVNVCRTCLSRVLTVIFERRMCVFVYLFSVTVA